MIENEKTKNNFIKNNFGIESTEYLSTPDLTPPKTLKFCKSMICMALVFLKVTPMVQNSNHLLEDLKLLAGSFMI